MVGGLYAMFAIGLALIFGVMKLVNIAHGDLIVLAAYIGLIVTQTLGIGPLTALVFVIPIMALVGYALQRGLFNRTMGGESDAAAARLLRPLGHHAERFPRAVLGRQPAPSGRRAGSGEHQAQRRRQRRACCRSLQLGLAILVIAGLQGLLYRTALGRAFRAVSDDPRIAELMGLETGVMCSDWRWRCRWPSSDWPGCCWPFAPISIRPPGRRVSFSASRRSSSAACRAFGARWRAGSSWASCRASPRPSIPGLQVLAGHVAFLIVLAIRPYGLFGRPE